MIPFEKKQKQQQDSTSVLIIGLGGAGTNIIERISPDGLDGAKLLLLNTDIRTLCGSEKNTKIQLGEHLTKGLGTGGDPALGRQAAEEAEFSIREHIQGQHIVFLCTGLGGGTGSGAAPLVARIAREEGALLVTFTTIPFPFEGARRREQADTALNELSTLSNALVTFDNARMGELIVDDKGIHQAFAAADRLISNSIKAITRLATQPGLINIGLDDLMTTLDTTRSRCLFGSGTAKGDKRGLDALEEALTSPLLDRGSLLEKASTVLVHICGGKDLTLHEVDQLMQELTKHTPEDVHLLFGSSVDSTMKDSLSVTIISSLPEYLVQPVHGDEESESDKAEEQRAIGVPGVEQAGDTENLSNPTVDPSPGDIEPLYEEPFGYTEGDVSDPIEEGEEPVLLTGGFEDVSESTAEESGQEKIPLPPVVPSPPTPKPQKPLLPPAPVLKKAPQAELELDGGEKGRFKNGNLNLDEAGEDLDTPAFLRRARKK